MGFLRDPNTGEMVPQTTVTGSINLACGTRLSYDDNDPTHRVVRRCQIRHDHAIHCPEHDKQEIIESVAVTGPPELLWPDPLERAEVEWEIAIDKGYC